MQHPLAGRQPAGPVLDHEVGERDGDLDGQQPGQDGRPRPATPPSRSSRTGTAYTASRPAWSHSSVRWRSGRRAAAAVLVVPERVDGAEDAVGEQQDHDGGHVIVPP